MITTERTIVRKFLEKDYEDLYAYLSLESIYRYEPGSPIDLDTAKRMAGERAKGDDFYAVELRAEKKVIGHLSFQHIEPKEWMTWEVGYIFHPTYQGKGYATEAARALIAYAFEDLQAHRVIAQCNPENTASGRLLERIGMRREGLLRQNVFFRKDEAGQPLWCDTYTYAVLKSDRNYS